jgi:hypothetical protein
MKNVNGSSPSVAACPFIPRSEPERRLDGRQLAGTAVIGEDAIGSGIQQY